VMEHLTKDGKPRLVESCSYPLTALGAVQRIYTSLAVIDVTPQGFVLREIVPGLDFAQLQAVTGAPLLTEETLHG
jgi:3-oxoadipate CoA-transferase beta subunit